MSNKQTRKSSVHTPRFVVAGVVRATGPRGGALGGVELLLLVVLQLEGLQRVHSPVKQRVVEQNLGEKEQQDTHLRDRSASTEQEGPVPLPLLLLLLQIHPYY